MKEDSAFSKLQRYRNLTIRWFSIISKTLAGESYSSAEIHLIYSTAPADWASLQMDNRPLYIYIYIERETEREKGKLITS